MGGQCELDLCAEFCLNGGSCQLRADGWPQCSCTAAYTGSSCDVYKCANYCQNDGFCYIPESTSSPYCMLVSTTSVCVDLLLLLVRPASLLSDKLSVLQL